LALLLPLAVFGARIEAGLDIEGQSDLARDIIRAIDDEDAPIPSLRSILGDRLPPAGAQLYLSLSNVGDSCTTPDGEEGMCDYITNKGCNGLIARYHSPEGRTERFLSQLLNLAEEPCGFAGFEYTVCCTKPAEAAMVVEQSDEKSTPDPIADPERCGETPFAVRIVGGSEVRPGQWPWAVAIGFPNATDKGKTFFSGCTGSIINSRYVLSAAHCFPDPIRATHVRLGEHNVETFKDKAFPMDVEIEKVILHEDYTVVGVKNDIAVVRLSKEIKFRQGFGGLIGPIDPICKPYSIIGKDLASFQDPVVIGWGRTSTTGPVSGPLKQVSRTILIVY
jgi:hypothetical protein